MNTFYLFFSKFAFKTFKNGKNWQKIQFFPQSCRTPFKITVAARNKRFAHKGRWRCVDEQILFIFSKFWFLTIKKVENLKNRQFLVIFTSSGGQTLNYRLTLYRYDVFFWEENFLFLYFFYLNNIFQVMKENISNLGLNPGVFYSFTGAIQR